MEFLRVLIIKRILSNQITYACTLRSTRELEDESFKECSRGAPKKVFIRERKLPFKKLILFVMNTCTTYEVRVDMENGFSILSAATGLQKQG